MEAVQEEVEKKLREEYEEQLKDKEDALVARLVEEQEKLKEERQTLEERLKKNTESMFCAVTFANIRPDSEFLACFSNLSGNSSYTLEFVRLFTRAKRPTDIWQFILFQESLCC